MPSQLVAAAVGAEDPALTFAAFGRDLAENLDAPYDPRRVDEDLLAQEVMVGCTQGMLLCLDPEHRMAYVLGDVLQLNYAPTPASSRTSSAPSP